MEKEEKKCIIIVKRFQLPRSAVIYWYFGEYRHYSLVISVPYAFWQKYRFQKKVRNEMQDQTLFIKQVVYGPQLSMSPEK